jgi:hypothetical protein
MTTNYVGATLLELDACELDCPRCGAELTVDDRLEHELGLVDELGRRRIPDRLGPDCRPVDHATPKRTQRFRRRLDRADTLAAD